MFYRSMDQIRKAAGESSGSRYWFSAGAMESFGTIVESDAIGGHWFVTSEEAERTRGDYCRVYSVRFCDDKGEVSTAPGTTVGQYVDLGDALEAAHFIAEIVKAYASEDVTDIRL